MTVKPHKATRTNCKKCGVPHSEEDHRFHLRGAFYDTHISAKVSLKKKLHITTGT